MTKMSELELLRKREQGLRRIIATACKVLDENGMHKFAVTVAQATVDVLEATDLGSDDQPDSQS
jgi:alpha-D-ribose 1-methylphosphonate 5-triphosphate synthase subunit PhnH